MSNDVLQVIRSRRVVRTFADRPLAQQDLEAVIEAARWAPCASNSRLQKFVVVQNPRRIHQIRAVSPGMFGHPAALVVICTDRQKAIQEGFPPPGLCGLYIDIGTSAENMLLAAHALGLGAGPVTSFSREAVKVLLNLPGWLSPDMIVCLGYPAQETQVKRTRPARPLHWRDLTFWECYDGEDQGA